MCDVEEDEEEEEEDDDDDDDDEGGYEGYDDEGASILCRRLSIIWQSWAL